jgi:hypothetical protein
MRFLRESEIKTRYGGKKEAAATKMTDGTRKHHALKFFAEGEVYRNKEIRNALCKDWEKDILARSMTEVLKKGHYNAIRGLYGQLAYQDRDNNHFVPDLNVEKNMWIHRALLHTEKISNEDTYLAVELGE